MAAGAVFAGGEPDFYMKDGVYAQTGASPEMQVYIKNIKFWTHP
jgi:hypothetical protein